MRNDILIMISLFEVILLYRKGETLSPHFSSNHFQLANLHNKKLQNLQDMTQKTKV
jgi:hypothetical protein